MKYNLNPMSLTLLIYLTAILNAGFSNAKSLEKRVLTPTGISRACNNFRFENVHYGTTVCVGLSGTDLIVTYPEVYVWPNTTPFPYESADVWIGTGQPPSTSPGGYPYRTNNGYCTFNSGHTAVTCKIPLNKFTNNACAGVPFNIITHAHVTDQGEAWGGWDCVEPDCDPKNYYWSFDITCEDIKTCYCCRSAVNPFGSFKGAGSGCRKCPECRVGNDAPCASPQPRKLCCDKVIANRAAQIQILELLVRD
ncbi:hypothetical protein MW887_011374 [Aspergillus wentii]|nr:hypothetical protein MW887_011374 [Aspergillus wentii]